MSGVSGGEPGGKEGFLVVRPGNGHHGEFAVSGPGSFENGIEGTKPYMNLPCPAGFEDDRIEQGIFLRALSGKKLDGFRIGAGRRRPGTGFEQPGGQSLVFDGTRHADDRHGHREALPHFLTEGGVVSQPAR